nr:immunoglobulin heavy chain junction region [Macaca mulatta]MOV42692.1 immunoglobulin heavy chain junction region [Macaca mulatta]MOV43096.1 immunoglobulin heavy chain junction region [Macaca mulatta]
CARDIGPYLEWTPGGAFDFW